MIEKDYSSINYNLCFHFLLKIIFISLISFFNNNNLLNHTQIVDLDNDINDKSFYESDIEFKNIKNEIKIFSIYYPEYAFIKISSNNYKNSSEIYINHNNDKIQNEIKKTRLEELNYLVIEQVKSAKNHGLYGFGIIYYLYERLEIFDEILKIFIEQRKNYFPFFLIIKNYNFSKIKHNTNNLLIQSNSEENKIKTFLNHLKQYIMSNNYVSIKNKPLFGVWEPIDMFFLLNLRRIANDIGLAGLYIIVINDNNEIQNTNDLFNGFTELKEFPSKSLYIDEKLKNIYFFNYYYDFIRKKNISENEFLNLNIIEGSSSEKFYLISKYMINLAKNKKRNNFILINAWNNIDQNYFLEYNEYHGYSYLNSLSKALLNLNFSSNQFYLNDLNNKSKIVVQAHIFYEHLISEIINKINNIPVKFDLYISTISGEMKYNIMKYINNSHSKANFLEIVIYKNKGRDILPFLTQLKIKFKNYKYICHVHTKRSINPYIGFLWRNYLYNNLLGDANIISEILSNFENSKKLGILFPETYYLVYNESKKLKKKTKKYLNFLLRKIFPTNVVGPLRSFPAGNMFWSRTKAIFQMFIVDFYKYFPNENDDTNDTIMHGIERIWLYLAKLNGFYYKIIFKRF